MKKINSTQQSIKTPLVLIAIAWLFAVCSLYLEYLFGQNLFSRSGAMMVLFSMIAEYNLLAVRDNYHNEKLQLLSKGEKIDFKKIHPKKSHQYMETIAHITVVTGTIVWGYGDLL